MRQNIWKKMRTKGIEYEYAQWQNWRFNFAHYYSLSSLFNVPKHNWFTLSVFLYFGFLWICFGLVWKDIESLFQAMLMLYIVIAIEREKEVKFSSFFVVVVVIVIVTDNYASHRIEPLLLSSTKLKSFVE